MSTLSLLARDLVESLDHILLPAARTASQLPLALAGTPYVPPGMQCTSLLDQPQVPTSIDQSFPLGRRCKHSGYQVLTVPYFIAVVEGIAAFRTGAIAESAAGPSVGAMQWRLPAGTFLLIPAGVAHLDTLHGTEPSLPGSRLRLFWAHLLPLGALCHSCLTRDGKHTSQPYVLAEDKYLTLLLEVLAEEVRGGGNKNQSVAHFMLLSFLMRLRSGLSGATRISYGITMWLPDPKLPTPRPLPEPGPGPNTVAEARDYIQLHLHEKLTPAQIAAHVGLTPARLNTLFRAHFDLSLMAYVTQQRMSYAMWLLEHFPISIGEVARRCGYIHIGHFSRAFSRHTGMTPLHFRRSVQKTALPNNQ